ncbi:hypothetical protein QAD02_023164, partial [Eretmocerus hayati]
SGSSTIPIPCKNDLSCRLALEPSQKYRCMHDYCMCMDEPGGKWKNCSMNAMVVGAKPKLHNSRCDHDDDCYWFLGSKCFELTAKPNSTKRCGCPEHMVISSNLTEEGQTFKCLEVVREPGKACIESIQCVKGLGNDSECIEGHCKCKTKFHFASSTTKRCIPDKVFGETCSRDEESCYQLAGPHNLNSLSCSSRGFCRCLSSYKAVNGTCQYS